MTDIEFENVVDLERVRGMQRLMMDLDPRVGPILKDEEHAAVRRTLRAWEQRFLAVIAVRKARTKADDKQGVL